MVGGHLSSSDQLSLVVVKAMLKDPSDPKCEAVGELPGAGAAWRWTAAAENLWALLREEVQGRLESFAAWLEVYTVICANAETLGEEGVHRAIFKLGCLAEHSCVPSTFKEILCWPPGGSSSDTTTTSPSSSCWQQQQGRPKAVMEAEHQQHPCQLVIRAHEDLDEGDVISISYVPEYLPTWRRQDLLTAGYSLACACDRCTRETELVCAYVCPVCGGGPCSPTAPVVSRAEPLRGLTLRCEECNAETVEEGGTMGHLIAAESAEVLSAEVLCVLHPFHHRVFQEQLERCQTAPSPADRVRIGEQLVSAQRRLTHSKGYTLLGRLCEMIAAAHLEMNEHHQAAASLQRAREFYASSHRGTPDGGHDERCSAQQTRAMAGPLGSPPRRSLRSPSTITRSPSLPSLAEGDGD